MVSNCHGIFERDETCCISRSNLTRRVSNHGSRLKTPTNAPIAVPPMANRHQNTGSRKIVAAAEMQRPAHAAFRPSSCTMRRASSTWKAASLAKSWLSR